MHALTSGRTHERVVVQSGNRSDAALLRNPWQVEREIEQVVHVQHVRGRRVEHVAKLRIDSLGLIRLGEATKLPVVDDLDDDQTFVGSPPDCAVWHRRIVLGCEDEDVRSPAQFARQLERVDLGAGAMPGQKIMDRVQNPHVTGRG